MNYSDPTQPVVSREQILAFRCDILVTDAGQEMVRDKLVELRNVLARINSDIESTKRDMAGDSAGDTAISVDVDWFHKWWLEHYSIPDAKKVYAWVRRFKNMLRDTDGMVEVKDEFDVEMIKRTVEISTIMDRSARTDYRDRAVYHCPFHEEKTPSFTVYKNNNSWYCFSCNSGGDIISLYMKLYECSFIEACKQLSQ